MNRYWNYDKKEGKLIVSDKPKKGSVVETFIKLDEGVYDHIIQFSDGKTLTRVTHCGQDRNKLKNDIKKMMGV